MIILPLPIDKMLLKNYEEDFKQISTGSTIYNTPLNRGKVSSLGRVLADCRAGGRGSLFPVPDQYSGS